MSRTEKKWRLGVLVSGSGSNLQSIMDACNKNEINAQVAVVISNNKNAYGLVRAREANIDTELFEPEKFKTKTEMCAKMAKRLKEKDVDLVCLAGYLLKLEPCMIRSFPHRIINIHPALLPKFGGKGMYGLNVHKAVLEAKEKQSGCTIHMVDEVFDNGAIVAQQTVPVEPNDTPETLQKRVLNVEHQLYPAVINDICRGKYDSTIHTT